MRSLKITLTLTALVAVFLLTVSGQSSANTQLDSDSNTFEVNKTEHVNGFAGIDKKKKPPVS